MKTINAKRITLNGLEMDSATERCIEFRFATATHTFEAAKDDCMLLCNNADHFEVFAKRYTVQAIDSGKEWVCFGSLEAAVKRRATANEEATQHYQSWEATDDSYIVEHDHLRASELAKKLGRTTLAVRERRRVLRHSEKISENKITKALDL